MFKMHLVFTGHYAVNGSWVQVECEQGTYAPEPGMSACEPCGLGFYCEDKAMDYKVACPPGNYCPFENGTTYYKCPTGTYSNQ